MSLCCELGAGSVFLSDFCRGEPYASQSLKNSPRKVHKDPMTAEVCTLECIYASSSIFFM
ncbi:Hypothetical protein FKW44_006632 [Caligus rogercresseyi]|uniref:Uncharacterized protein n=1 Tax=Caligus rogercresseyi TaxID=217165 RepID=A0A7T8KDK7_CALRO|nr:Hypothetical protein FKW44_006632 [Caligus rogercresseyi]